MVWGKESVEANQPNIPEQKDHGINCGKKAQLFER